MEFTDSIKKTIEFIEKYPTVDVLMNSYSNIYNVIKDANKTLYLCQECRLRFANQQELEGHHCDIKDIFKSGVYHWFKYNVTTKKIQSIFFGQSKNILEHLKFLALPARYLVALDPHEKCKDEAYVNKIESAFGEKNDEFIYLNFIEMSADHDRKKMTPEQSQKLIDHARLVCIRDCSDKSLLTNAELGDEQLKKIEEGNSYEYYMKKTADDLSKENFLKFSREQFGMLTSIINQDTNFINNVNQFKKSDSALKNEIISFLDKAYLIKNRCQYKALVQCLDDIKNCNGHDFKYMPTLYWRY